MKTIIPLFPDDHQSEFVPDIGITAAEADRMENLSVQILHVQEAERRRISRELHDEVGHALMAISINLAALRRTSETGDEALKAKFEDTHQLVQQTMDIVHRFARELRPAMLDDLGLVPALRAYARDFSNRTGIGVEFRCGAGLAGLDEERKTVIFRIAQESLSNVAKHAHAERVEFSIRKVNSAVVVEIADDGISFTDDPMVSARRKRRLGLVGMQERARLVNGTFAIVSRPGEGTIVRAIIPFKAESPARRCRRLHVMEDACFTPALAEAA